MIGRASLYLSDVQRLLVGQEVTAEPFAGSFVKNLDQASGTAGDYAVGWKAFCHNRIRANDAVPAKNELPFATKNDAAMTEPGVASDGDSTAFGDSLFMNRAVDIRVLMVMIHDEDRGSEKDVLFKLDLVEGRDGGTPANFATLANDQLGAFARTF